MHFRELYSLLQCLADKSKTSTTNMTLSWAWTRSDSGHHWQYRPNAGPILVYWYDVFCGLEPMSTISPITVTSYDRHGVPNHHQINCLFNRLFSVHQNKTLKISHYWPFIRGIRQSSVGSRYKGQFMRKAFPSSCCRLTCWRGLPETRQCKHSRTVLSTSDTRDVCL